MEVLGSPTKDDTNLTIDLNNKVVRDCSSHTDRKVKKQQTLIFCSGN